MLVKLNEKQISFLFQEADAYFEMNYMILEQEKISGMLPFRRAKQNGKEKLLFQTEGYEPLFLVLPGLEDDEIVDILYAIVYMTKKIEENGFMKKECIWCRFEDIYFDLKARRPFFAVLPITQEVRYTEGSGWEQVFLHTLGRIAEFLSDYKYQCIRKLIAKMESGKYETIEILEEINSLGNGMSSRLIQRKEEISDNYLKLIYSGKDGTFCFTIENEDFAIGRNSDEVQGVLQLSAKVSRKHCLITKINRNYFVQDLDSANHTYVNGIRIPAYELMQLEQNDVLSLADVDLRVCICENENNLI